jgi:hypothetical protein
MAGPVPLRGSRHSVPRTWYVFQSYSTGGEESNRELAAADGE